MAKAYLAGKSASLGTRTWHEAIAELAKSYEGTTAKRWTRFAQSLPIMHLRGLPIIETDSSDFLAVLRHPRAGTSTNVWLRRLHNFVLDMGWLLSPVLNRRLSPLGVTLLDRPASQFWTALRMKGVREAIESCGAQLLYLPAYSPDLNPIEMTFSKLKAHLRKAARRNFDGLLSATADALHAFTSLHCRNFFLHAHYRYA